MTTTWLADVLRAAGLTVDETLVPDWKQRGHTDGPFAPVGVLGHHTAGSATGDLPSLATVRDGRSDLAGPLSNLMLARSGVWVPIAAGRCWHAGAADNPAAWPWVPNGDGNGHLIGIEAESAGTGDWTPEQIDSYPRGVAALLAQLGAGPDRFLGHLEWAPSRKPDPHGWPGGMNGFRATLANGPTQGDDMTPDQFAYLQSMNGKLDRATNAAEGVWHMLKGSHTDSADRLTDLWAQEGVDAATIEQRLDALAQLGAPSTPTSGAAQPIDYAELAKHLTLPSAADIAAEVVKLQNAQARDGDPATGPVS